MNQTELMQKQQQLTEQLKQVQFKLFDQTSEEVVQHINDLQLEKAKQQGRLQQAQTELNQLMPQLENCEMGAEQILLEAISQQDWYAFKNKREIIFDRRTGILFPNFEFVPHIPLDEEKKANKEFAPNGIGKKQWKQLHEIGGCEYCFVKHGKRQDFNYPKAYRGQDNVNLCGYFSRFKTYANNQNYHIYYLKNFRNLNFTLDHSGSDSSIEKAKILLALKILDNPYIDPEYIGLTTQEKAKIILDFFIEQDWIPKFEPFLEKNETEDEDDFQERLATAQAQSEHYNEIFEAYYQRIQLQKQLVELEQELTQLPEPEPENFFTSDFDYQIELKNYNLPQIKQSVWQYSLACQTWLNHLLAQIDDWENRHQDLVKKAVALNNILNQKQPSSTQLSEAENTLLNTRHQDLKASLNFSLEPLRAVLLELLQEPCDLEKTLQHTTSLKTLAEIENTTRPSFELVAEHSALRCVQTLKQLEWLQTAEHYIEHIVASEQKTKADFLILLDKYQQDLAHLAQENNIEANEVKQWFEEWRNERYLLLKQWQPLVQAGLNNTLSQQTVLDTLQCIEAYQQKLDAFYLQKRIGIHTQYAFQANGHRQEKLEKEQELTKLVHEFMQNLEKVIFATENTAQKIWLVRFSEVWQQNIVQEIADFLEKEQVIERDDIVKIMSEELRKVQQQNLTACLQDAQSYSNALAQREKDFSTLMFKMRKALQK